MYEVQMFVTREKMIRSILNQPQKTTCEKKVATGVYSEKMIEPAKEKCIGIKER